MKLNYIRRKIDNPDNQDVLERLQKEVGNTLTWWVEDDTILFESIETNKQTEAYIDDFEYNFEKTLKIIKSELK